MENITEKFNKLMRLPNETEIVEWKEAKNSFSFQKLGKYFSALSNEANLKNSESAWLLLGIKNDKNIVGTDYKKSKKSLNKLKSDVAMKTTINISFIDIHEVEAKGKRVLLFEIPPAPAGIPIGWEGHFYARNGEVLTPLGIEKMERIRNQKKQKDWSRGICYEAKISDLDPEAIEEAKKGFMIKYPKIPKEEIKRWGTITFLNKAGLTIKDQITKTAIILIGKPESEHFIEFGTSKISWILKDQNGIEKDYEHFTCPLILSITKVHKKIRNLKYRYISDRSLFPDEIDRYDPFTIREALNNAIAHQDYEMGGKINVVENENDSLVFSNLGGFIPKTIENVIEADSPAEYYRNKFLADAMVKVNMIDSIGSGIKKMFISQKNRFFPLPEYDLSHNKVKLTIIGKVLDVKYAQKLAQIPSLDLKTIMILDKIQKRKKISKKENKNLRGKGLIEGKSPNLYISVSVADVIGEKSAYIKNRGFKDSYYKKIILEYLTKYKKASRLDIDELILDILPGILDKQQRKNKVKNIIYAMSKKDKTIVNKGTNRHPRWEKV